MNTTISKLKKVLGLILWFQNVPKADKARVVKAAGKVLIEHALDIANVLETHLAYIIRVFELTIKVVQLIDPAIPELEAKVKETGRVTGELVDAIGNSKSGQELEESVMGIRLKPEQRISEILVGDDIA